MTTTPANNLVMSATTRVRNSLTRNFSYNLTDKKATTNFLKAASREPIEIDEKQRCIVLTFSIGAYAKCVLPVLKYWEGEKNPFTFETMNIKPLSFIPGHDETGKHVDTVIAFNVAGKKVTVSCFNTTQKIKIEGNGYNDFTDNYLVKLFNSRINKLGTDIDDYNKGVIASLSRKRKIVNRPVRNVRYRSISPLICDFCDLTFPNSGQLSVHKKRKHTDLALKVSSRIPIIDDLSLMDLSSDEQNSLLALKLEEQSVPKEHLENKCDNCGSKFPLGQLLKGHKCTDHNLDHENSIIVSSNEPEDYVDKDANKVPDSEQNLFSCTHCQYNSTSQDELDFHVTSQHKEHVVMQSEALNKVDDKAVMIKCNCCEYETTSSSESKAHEQLHHMQLRVSLDPISVISCTECSFKCRLNIQLRKHMKSSHYHETKHTCSVCEFVCNSSSNIVVHYMSEHVDEVPEESHEPETLSETLDYLTKHSKSLNKEVKLIQTALKKSYRDVELLLTVGMNKIINENNVKFEAINDLIKKANSKVNHVGRKVLENDKNNPKSKSACEHESQPTPKYVSVSTQTDLITTSHEESTASSIEHDRKAKSDYLQRPKILYVTDSVGCNANMRLVEELSGTRIRTMKSSGSGKELSHVVQSNLDIPGKEPYNILALAAPTDDISNLKTSNHSRSDLEKQVTDSCENMINIAKDALDKHKLENIIVVEHPPRFDDKIRTELASFANTVLKKKIEKLGENRILIGNHSLKCVGIGKTFEARYRNTLTRRMDGLHFFGPLGVKTYSESLINIFTPLNKKLISIPQSSDRTPQPNIQVSNRFECLSQGNF